MFPLYTHTPQEMGDPSCPPGAISKPGQALHLLQEQEASVPQQAASTPALAPGRDAILAWGWLRVTQHHQPAGHLRSWTHHLELSLQQAWYLHSPPEGSGSIGSGASCSGNLLSGVMGKMPGILSQEGCSSPDQDGCRLSQGTEAAGAIEGLGHSHNTETSGEPSGALTQGNFSLGSAAAHKQPFIWNLICFSRDFHRKQRSLCLCAASTTLNCLNTCWTLWTPWATASPKNLLGSHFPGGHHPRTCPALREHGHVPSKEPLGFDDSTVVLTLSIHHGTGIPRPQERSGTLPV